MVDTSRSHGDAAKRAKRGTEAKGRKPTGQVRAYSGASRVVTYSLRVRWHGQRLTIRLGSELEGWNRPLADRKLEQTVAEIEAGVWRPPVADIAPEERDPFFHEFATLWLDRHTVDLAGSTKANYSHILTRYLLPEFKDHRLSEITHELVQRWRDRLRQEAEAAKAREAERRQPSGQARQAEAALSGPARSTRRFGFSARSSSARSRASTTPSNATQSKVALDYE